MKSFLTLILLLFGATLSSYAQMDQLNITRFQPVRPIAYNCTSTNGIMLFNIEGRIKGYQTSSDHRVFATISNLQQDEDTLFMDIIDSTGEWGTFKGQHSLAYPGYEIASIDLIVGHEESGLYDMQQQDMYFETLPLDCDYMYFTFFHDIDKDGVYNNSDTILNNVNWKLSILEQNQSVEGLAVGEDSILLIDQYGYRLFGQPINMPVNAEHGQVLTSNHGYYHIIFTGPNNHYKIPYTISDTIYTPHIVNSNLSSQPNFESSNCRLPSTIDFTASYVASESGSQPVNVHINFGDGSDSSFVTSLEATATFKFSHIYRFPGKFNTQVSFVVNENAKKSTEDFTLTNDCKLLIGGAYRDQNDDCTLQFEEGLIPNAFVQCITGDSTKYTFTNENGIFSFDTYVNQSKLVFNEVNYTTACQDTMFVVDSLLENGALMGFSCKSTGPDLSAEFIPYQTIRPGFTIDAGVFVQNTSCINSFEATTTLTLDPKFTLLSAEPTPSSVNGNVITWTIPAISYEYPFEAALKLTMSASASIGDVSCSKVEASSAEADLDTTNNISFRCHQIRGSYDPNDKICLVNGTEKEKFIPSDELIYRIRFQNTGTDTAFNIFVLDTIHPNLDLTTFQVLSYSHPMSVSIDDGRTIRFQFSDILLPDDKINEPKSHGYVTYKIRPLSTLVPKDVITNTGYIYFDYNEAIITNTTKNQVSSPDDKIDELVVSPFSVFPVPANQTISVNGPGKIDSMKIFDLLGREVLSIKGYQENINVSDLTPGVYLLKLNSSHKEFAHRIVISR